MSIVFSDVKGGWYVGFEKWQDLHVVRRMVNKVPKKRQPIIFCRSFKFFICGKQRRSGLAGARLGFC